MVVVTLGVTTGIVAARHNHARGVRLFVGGIGVVLVADTFAYVVGFASGHFHSSGSLPLALCNVLVPVAAVACLTRYPTAVELTYFLGIAGTLQGVVTPDLATPFPHLVFFEYVAGHLGVVAAGVLLVAGVGITPRPGSWRRIYLGVLVYCAVVGVVDATTNANYLFLARPPANWTVLRLLGPWPWYLVTGSLVAALLLVVLDLPFSRARRGAGRRFVRVPIAGARGWAFAMRGWAALLVVGPVSAALISCTPGVERRWRLLQRALAVLQALSGVRVVVDGEPPPPGGILVSNHGSFADGAVLIAAVPQRLEIAAGAALAHQFVAGRFLRTIGCLFVGDPAEPVDSQLERLEGAARRGRLAVFPEGHLPVTTDLAHFHLGAFVVAVESGAQIVPTAIAHSRAVLPPGSRAIRPGVIRVRFGDPLDPGSPAPGAARRLAVVTRNAVAHLLASIDPETADPLAT